jgi:hypothetical protein
VKVVATLPSEQGGADATATMLRNTVERAFTNWPKPTQDQLIELAGAEIDRIFTAPFLDVPKEEPPVP